MNLHSPGTTPVPVPAPALLAPLQALLDSTRHGRLHLTLPNGRSIEAQGLSLIHI